MTKEKKKILSLLIVLMMIVTNLNLIAYASNDTGATDTVKIYFKDLTDSKWVANDNATMCLIDNTHNHVVYNMTKDSEEADLWYAEVPESAYNITFNRYDKDGVTQWNSWSAGGRDNNNVYAADGAEYGHWYYVDDTKTFSAGDIVYLDLRSFDKWKKDSAIFYVEFDNGNTHVLDYEVEENVFAYIVTKNDEGAKKLSFYRGNETDKWNSSIKLTINDYNNDLDLVKVTGWNKKGSLGKYEGSISYYRDSDGDGLSDYREAILGTDKNKRDTDEDGLSDYDELVYVGSDPLVYDSLVSGIADGDVDIDEDGLTNAEEMEYSSNPKKADSDNDGLNDYDEVKVYNTNPKKADSDNDGLVDIEEIDLSTNPNIPDTDENGILDGDEYFVQEVSEERYSEGLNDENIATLNYLKVSAKGSVNRHINVSEYTGEMLGDTRAFVGKVVEISDSDINGGTIEFKIDESYTVNNYVLGGVETNGLLICYNNGEETVPLETVYDSETRTMRAEITSAGIYFIFDVIRFMESSGLTTINDTSVDASSVADSAVTEITLDDADSDEINAQADIVFVIDTTGSMGSPISNVKNNIIGFVDELKEDNITANYALVDYRDITCDGRNYTNVVKNGIFNFYSNPESFKSAISSLKVNGGGDRPETAIDGLEMARRLDFRKNSQKFVILVTDADYKVDNNYGIASMEEMKNLFIDDEINVSVISRTSYQTLYSGLYGETGGIFADIYGNFRLQLSSIAELIKSRTNDGYWIALNGLIPNVIKLDAKPEFGSDVDTDGDTVSDVDELGSANPTKMFKVNAFLHYLGLPEDYSEEYLPMYDYISNPVEKNTDGDGLDDSLDNAPRNSSIHSFLIYETPDTYADLNAVRNSDVRTKSEALEINGHTQNDYKYADKTKTELCDMDWISWMDFAGVRKEDYLYSFKDLVTDFSMGDMEDTALNMVDHFMDGTGTDYSDATLNAEVENHENSVSYDEGVKECINDLLAENGGNMKALKYDASNRDASLMPAKMRTNPKTDHNPSYNDKFSGLGICVDGIYGLKIEVTAFNSEDNSYELHYTLYDIYGLDETDITDKMYGIPFGVLAGFRSWYILQHFDEYAGDVKPFITCMEFDK
ncbi:conserved hypothetical protein [Lachnospiraceae bacterium RM5]|nr:conserved hypothetical protein [Lachnospiraceae bacterium RM5]